MAMFAGEVLISIRRSGRRRWLLWVVSSGAAAGLLAALYAFLATSMPIAPYEQATGRFWLQLAAIVGTFAIVGFGAGVLAAAVCLVLLGAGIRLVRGDSTPEPEADSPPEESRP
jgi:hypothetical protein